MSDVDERYEKLRLAFDMHHEMTYHEMCAVIERLRDANSQLSEAVFEAIQSLEEWGAAEELAPGIARWRAAARLLEKETGA